MTRAWWFSQTSMVLTPTGLWSTTMEWLLWLYQSTWNSSQSAAYLTWRKIRTKDFLWVFFFLFFFPPFSPFNYKQHSRTLKDQDVYVQLFSHTHKTRVNLSRMLSTGCFLDVLLSPSTLLHIHSFLKSLNQNVTSRSFPFFEKMSTVLIPKMNGRNLNLLEVWVDSQTWLQKYDNRGCFDLKLTALYSVLALTCTTRTYFQDC